jgi:hypothetical protein
MRTKPAFFSAMQTADGLNTAGMRYKSLTGSKTQLFIEEEISKDKEREHTTEVVGYIALWGDSISYSDLGDGKIVRTDYSAKHRVQRLPLKESSLYFKSIEWTVSAVTEKHYSQFEQMVFTQDRNSKDGYCERLVRDFSKCSNKLFCKKAATKNVGYYYRAAFPNYLDNSMWCFRFSNTFSKGGAVMVDGKKVKSFVGTNKGKAGSLNFCMKLTKGNHLIEIFGANAVDVTTSWTFAVAQGKWMKFTCKSLDTYMRRPKRTTKATSVLLFGDITASQNDPNVWHKVAIKGTFKNPVVIMGAPSSNEKSPVTIRVKEVTRTSFKW